MIDCQMNIGLFANKHEDLLKGPEFGGAAACGEVATKADTNLYI